MAMFIKSKTKRGADCIILNGCTYRLEYTAKDAVKYWRCTVTGCRPRLNTDGEANTLIATTKDHNHEINRRISEKAMLRAAVIRRAEAIFPKDLQTF